jgi:fatty acid desaturase
LALNFQVSHIAEGVEWPHPHNEEKQEWAIAQIRASQDYAHGSLLTTWFSGALNYQVTHHLFPGVSQYVYPEIAPIVLKSCKKFGIPYRVLPSFRAALGSHIGHLKNLSYQSHSHSHSH